MLVYAFADGYRCFYGRTTCGSRDERRQQRGSTDLRQIESTEEHRAGTISTDGDPADVSDRASEWEIVRGVVTESSEAHELSNVVETALAKALLLAAEAGRWGVVGRIAAELEGRRTGRIVSAGRAKASR
jgi:hypothetical protein